MSAYRYPELVGLDRPLGREHRRLSRLRERHIGKPGFIFTFECRRQGD